MNIQLEVNVPSTVVIIFPLLTFIAWNFHKGFYRTLPLQGKPLWLFNNTYNQKTIVREKYYQWSFIA